MSSIPEVVCVLSCGFLLCLGPSAFAKAHNEAVSEGELTAGYFAQRHGGGKPAAKQRNDMERGQHRGGQTIKGEVLRVEGSNDFVQGPEEKEGRLRIDETTPRARSISFGIHDDSNF